MNKQHKAMIMMVLVTVVWGASYLFMKLGLESMGEFNLIFLRFGVAFLLSAIIFYRRLKYINKKVIKYSFVLGLILFLVFTFIMFGVKSTTASNAGFLVSLAVIFVPLLSAMLLKKQLETRVIVAVLLAVTGIGLLTLSTELTINGGDALCIGGALCYAMYVIATAKLTQHVDSITLGVLQLGWCAAIAFLFSLGTNTLELPHHTDGWIAVLGLGILCSAFGFIGQVVAQQHTSPSSTALIFTLEPVFTAIFAFLFMNEALSTRGYIGALIVLAGVVYAEVDVKKLLSFKRRSAIYKGEKTA